MSNQRNMDDHVTFCHQSKRIMDRGAIGELRTVDFLRKNLRVRVVGDYRILVNYNLPMRGTDSREIDVLLINKFGVFLLEVKSWFGEIEAYEDGWYVDGTIRRDNAVESVNSKARILHSQMFSHQGLLSGLREVSVTGLVVLTEGVHRFKNYSSAERRAVVGLDNQLIRSVSSTDLLHRGPHSRQLSDEDIETIYEAILGRHLANRDDLVENYRILRKLREGDLFEEYAAQNVNIATQRVRIKRYQLQKLSASPVLIEADVLQFKRSIEVVSALGSHSNIVNTLNFFPDAKRPDVYYEVTELVDGQRLDEMMVKTRHPLSLDEQLDYLEPLCLALQHVHNHRSPEGKESPVYHRNISPETVFVTKDQVVKLADFDFAKYGTHTINPQHYGRGQVLIEKAYTAPEVLFNASLASPASDIYALGVIWYFLARLPAYNPDAQFKPEEAEAKIDALKLPEAARSLMKRMVAEAPVSRPQTIEEVMRVLKQLRQYK